MFLASGWWRLGMLLNILQHPPPPPIHTQRRINQSQKSLVPRLRKPDLTEVIESQKQKQKTHSKITGL